MGLSLAHLPSDALLLLSEGNTSGGTVVADDGTGMLFTGFPNVGMAAFGFGDFKSRNGLARSFAEHSIAGFETAIDSDPEPVRTATFALK